MGIDWSAVATITAAILLAQFIRSVYSALRARIGSAGKKHPQAEAA